MRRKERQWSHKICIMRIVTLLQVDTGYALNVIHMVILYVILRLAALLKEFIILFWISLVAVNELNFMIEIA